MNMIVAGGCFKSFGVIFTAVQDKYQASSAAISKIPAILLAIALGISMLLHSCFKRSLICERRFLLTNN